jgi:trehalose/maltose hydrolase-like predicted phosphorylase
VALVPSVLHDRPDEEAVRRVASARATGFENLRPRNHDAWDELWKGRIVVHGASRAIRRSSMLPSSISSVRPHVDFAVRDLDLRPRGLARLHYYFGHVMWDIDAFCVPPLILLQPDAALAMLDFRSRGLEAARSNARLSGREGLQFPWEAAPLSGQEAAPGAGDSAAHEDHGSLHTARAFGLYADATGDAAFLNENAWPVLSGRRRLDRQPGDPHGTRGLEILRSTGPAEVPDPPDNDAFTIMAAKQMLRRAARAAEQTGRVPPLPGRERRSAVCPGARRRRHRRPRRLSRQRTQGRHARLLSRACSPMITRRRLRNGQRTLEFYLRHWEEYVGAPMFPALYTTWASMAGDGGWR